MFSRTVRLVALGLAAAVSIGATALTGKPPWTAEHIVIGSTTDWDVYTAPDWARQVVIKNEHASGVLYLGRYDETGTFSSSNDEYITLPAGSSYTLTLTAGAGTADTVHRAIPLASSTASLPVGVLSVETPE